MLAQHKLPPAIGGHTVGGKDGGPGLPVANWSTLHGDVRVAHFTGLHALQVIPLLSWMLLRRRRMIADRARTRLVLTVSTSYAALFSILAWQALRGQSLVHPDGMTLVALGAWALASGALVSFFASTAKTHSFESSRAAAFLA